MKSLTTFICESISKLRSGQTGIIVFDIDDTLIRADKDVIKVHKYVDGDKKNIKRLSTEELANDPDSVTHPEWFDYGEFNNPQKVMSSIIKGTPIINNLRIMDAYVNAGYKMCFLTARGCEDAIKYALTQILQIKNPDGTKRGIGSDFDTNFSAAINDCNKDYIGNSTPEKKANVLKNICSKFDKVVFVDDDKKNIAYTRKLKLPNLTVIPACK